MQATFCFIKSLIFLRLIESGLSNLKEKQTVLIASSKSNRILGVSVLN